MTENKIKHEVGSQFSFYHIFILTAQLDLAEKIETSR